MIKKKPLVTVIIPMYNAEKYILDCLRSVSSQIYENIDILVINDGSTDNSKSIVADYAKRDHRVELINKENGGVSSARNLGIDRAKGQFIAFIDADDAIHSTYIENLVGGLISLGGDSATTSMKMMNSISIDDFLQKHVSTQDSVYKEYSSYDALTSLYNGTLEKGQNGCQIFRAQVIKDNHLQYDESMSIGEDFDFFARAILVSKKIIIDPREMYYYRRNEESAVHQEFNIKQFDAISNIQKTGRSIEHEFPKIKKALDNNQLVTSISYGALMYEDRKKYPDEFAQIQGNIKKFKLQALFSPQVKITGRVKVLIVLIFGSHAGLRIVKKLIRL